MRGDLCRQALHLCGVCLRPQEFAFGLIETRAQGKAFAFGEQVAGFVGGADGDAFQPGAAHGGGIGQRGGGDSKQKCRDEQAGEHRRTVGCADLG